jgi:hypothetical protein
MLGPPGRHSCVGAQRRQVEVSPAVIGPLLCGEARQNFDDIAESDVGIRCRLLACRRRKRDFAQDGERHGKDHGIGAKIAPSLQCTAIRLQPRRSPSRHDRAQIDRGIEPTVWRYEILDRRAIALREASMLTLSRPTHSSRSVRVLA